MAQTNQVPTRVPTPQATPDVQQAISDIYDKLNSILARLNALAPPS